MYRKKVWFVTDIFIGLWINDFLFRVYIFHQSNNSINTFSCRCYIFVFGFWCICIYDNFRDINGVIIKLFIVLTDTSRVGSDTGNVRTARSQCDDEPTGRHAANTKCNMCNTVNSGENWLEPFVMTKRCYSVRNRT